MAQLVCVGLASADRLPVVVRIPAGPLGSLKCDPPKGNGRRPQKKVDPPKGNGLGPQKKERKAALRMSCGHSIHHTVTLTSCAKFSGRCTLTSS